MTPTPCGRRTSPSWRANGWRTYQTKGTPSSRPTGWRRSSHPTTGPGRCSRRWASGWARACGSCGSSTRSGGTRGGAWLADVAGLSAVPGTSQFLDALPARSWAVVTSCGRALAELRLTSAGLPIPPILVTSEDVSQGKPAPDGYRLAAKRLGLDPAACIVFEDAPAGIAAARGAGAPVIALTTMLAARDLPGANATIPDFTAIHVHQDRDAFVVTTR